jgi:hypothetical protein
MFATKSKGGVKVSLQSIELTSAERNLIEVIFGMLSSTKADTARMAKAVRTALETKAINKRIEKFDGKAREVGIVQLSWDNLMDPADYLEALGEFIAEQKKSLLRDDEEGPARAEKLARVERLDKLVKRFEGIVETRTFTIDDLYLKWLRDLMIEKVDLSKRIVMNPSGSFSEALVPVNQDQLEVFATLVDKICEVIARGAQPNAPTAGEKK